MYRNQSTYLLAMGNVLNLLENFFITLISEKEEKLKFEKVSVERKHKEEKDQNSIPRSVHILGIHG